MQNGSNGGRKQAAVLALTLFNYVLLTLLRPGGLMAYLLPSACWGLVAATALKACGVGRIRTWFNRQVSTIAVLLASCYLILLMYAGLFSGFGRSPYSFAPLSLLLNATLVTSTLLGMELSRACVVKGFGMKRPFLTLGFVTLLYSFLGISVFRLMGLRDPFALTKFLGSSLLPAFAENLLASYLALLGGPLASLAYRGPLTAFWWFSPILPRLPWGIEALVGVMVPAAGFFAVTQSTPRMVLRRLGMETGGFRRPSARGWILASVFCVLMVWASTGLLGVQPTTVVSGSMRPALEVGDMVIVRQVPAASIKQGDIIQYWSGSEMIIHRVAEVQPQAFITKGDANDSPDPSPVQPSQVRGKVILTIPKLGWAAIGVKTFLASALSSPPLLLVLLSGMLVLFLVRGPRRKTSSRRLMTPLSLLLVGMIACGVSYAHWGETLYVSGTVDTGTWGSEIECYKVLSFPCGQVSSWRSEDNRTLYLHYWYTYPCDTVLVVAKVHNTGTVPVFFEGFQYQFFPPSLEGKFEVCECFFGPYSGDCRDLLCEVDSPDPCSGKGCWCRPVQLPVQLDPCQSLIAVVKLKSCTFSCENFTVSMSIRDECWACLRK